MSAEVYNTVRNRITVEVDPSTQAGFSKLASGAKAAGDAVEGVGGRGRSGLQNLGSQLRTTDRGMRQLQGGVFGLLGSLTMVDERFGKGLAVFAIMHSGMSTVRGLAGTMPMLTKAVGAMTSPVGIAAVGFTVLAGSVGYFAKKLHEATAGTNEQRAALARLQAQGLAIRDNVRLFGMQPEQMARAEREHGVMAPHLEKQRDLAEQMARAQSTANAIMRHPENAFQGEGMEALRNAGGEFSKLLGGPQARFGPGQQLAEINKQAEMMKGQALAPLEKQPLAQRGIDTAKEAAAETEKWFNDLQKGKAHVDALKASFKAMAEAEKGGARMREVAPEIDRLKKSLPNFWERNTPFGGTSEGEKRNRIVLQKLMEEQAKLSAEEPKRTAAMNRAMRGVGTMTADQALKDELDINKQLDAVGAKRKANADALKEAQAELNKLQREELKGRQEVVKETLKGVREQIQAEQNRVAGLKQSTGLMDPEQQARLLQLAQKFAAPGKQQFSPEDLALAQQHSGLFGEQIGKLGQAGFDASPMLKEIFRLTGQGTREKELKQAEEFLAKINVELKNQIDVTVKADEEAMVAEIKDKLLPILRDAFQQAVRSAAAEMEKDRVKQILEKQANERAGQK